MHGKTTIKVLLLGTSHTESKANITTFSNKCKLSFELCSGEILSQLRPNSAVTDKRLSWSYSFCMQLSEGQIGVKVIQLVPYTIYFVRMKSSFQYIIPQSRWDYLSTVAADLAAMIPSGNFSHCHFSIRNRMTRNWINRLINMLSPALFAYFGVRG